ncbi:MAG TPA: TonB-dependent receptor plug domain-containing protein [Thermoanaerobaculia bacterium]|nr:TonB-dependent receptor plug domain-containing protein [Thermoanaerobaculia bacterium]
MTSHPLPRILRAALLAALCAAPPLRAQANAQEDLVAAQSLKTLSIEELMQIDVTSVSRRSEPFFEAAAAVAVITADELRRSGVTSLPEALRLVNSLHVARQTQSAWAISARGFNSAAANKLLVLIDGRSVYTPLFSGVFWDVQDVLLEDVDRIEVVRGPGATIWGANAVNGVINVITKPASETQGGLAVAGAGNEERGFAAARWGGTLGERGNYRAYGKYASRGAMEFLDGSEAIDDMWLGQGGFRSDWKTAGGDGLTLQADAYTGRVGEPLVGDSNRDGGNLLGRWSRRSSERSGFELQVYLDRTHRSIPALFEEHRETGDVDFQQDLRLGTRQELIWGLGYRHTRDSVRNSRVIEFLPDHRAQDLLSAFVQDEVSFLDDRLRVTLGTKVEHNDSTGFEVQPNVRFSLGLGERRMLWGAVSRAVRTPTQFDEDLVFHVRQLPSVIAFLGSRDFESEKLVAYELGHRMRLGSGLILDNAMFYNVYDDLRSFDPAPTGAFPFTFGNRTNAETWGLETRINWEPAPWWHWHFAYAWLDGRYFLDPGSRGTAQREGNDPEHRIQVRSFVDLPGGVELDAWLRYVDRLPAPEVPSYLDLDLHLGWHPLSSLELALIGRNLLHSSHEEFGPAGPNREVVERSLYGRATWSF